MPAKSRKQQKFIFYLRNKYGNKVKTPQKYKWIWDKDWEKLEKKSFFLMHKKNYIIKTKLN